MVTAQSVYARDIAGTAESLLHLYVYPDDLTAATDIVAGIWKQAENEIADILDVWRPVSPPAIHTRTVYKGERFAVAYRMCGNRVDARVMFAHFIGTADLSDVLTAVRLTAEWALAARNAR